MDGPELLPDPCCSAAFSVLATHAHVMSHKHVFVEDNSGEIFCKCMLVAVC